MPDVAPPGSPTPARRAAPWIRLVLVGLVAVVAGFPALFIIAWFTFSGARFGWVASLGAFGLFGLATGWLAVTGRWPVARRRTAVGLAAVLGLAGIAAAHAAPPTPGRLRHAARQLEQPAWNLVDDSVEGNALCFDTCFSVTRRYEVDAGSDVVLRELRPRLSQYGLRARPSDPGRWEFADRGEGDIGLRVSVVGSSGGGTTVYVTADGSG
jgi:hypothetical protein